MKAFWSVLIGGLILQIFVDAAFKVDGIALTMFIHNAYMIAWGALCGYLLLRKMEVKQ